LDEKMNPDSRFWSWLPGALSRTGPDGRSRYAKEEVEDFLAVLAFALGVQPEEGPPVLDRAIGAFLGRVEAFALGDAGFDLDDRALAYLEAHPLPAELTFELRRAMQEGVVGWSAFVNDNRYAALLGTAPPQKACPRPRATEPVALTYLRMQRRR
jgi:hypothetical protein